jgi:hypothetical protein
MMIGVAAGAAGMALPAAASAATKVGTVSIEQTQVAFMGSANIGGGVLSFQGKSYRFTIGGLGYGGFGVSKMQATGDVFDMKELRQFSGPYGQARYGAAVGDRGSSQLWLQNPNGVTISLQARRQGLALATGADAIVIDLK